jgi:hypothetical protein
MKHNINSLFKKFSDNVLHIEQLNNQYDDIVANLPNINKTCAITNQTIQKLIYTFGPIIATIDNTQWSAGVNGNPIWYNVKNNTLSNYIGPAQYTKSTNPNHTIILIGWGNTQNKNYWIVKNSWGSEWANNGYTAIEFAHTPCVMFHSIAYIDPTILKPNFSQSIFEKTHNTNQSYLFDLSKNKFIYDDSTLYVTPSASGIFKYGGLIPTKLAKSRNIKVTAVNVDLDAIPSEYIKSGSIFCWATQQNPLKRSIVSSVKDQGRCNSCWIFDCLDILSSSIVRNSLSNKVLNFSVQKFINIIDSNVCKTGGTLDNFNTILKQHESIFLQNTCPYLNNSACKSENKCKTKIGCGKKFTIDTNSIADDVLGGSRKLQHNRSSHTSNKNTFNQYSIIFLVLMIFFFIILVFQLFRLFRKYQINKNILTGTILCFIITTILFSLFVTHII